MRQFILPEDWDGSPECLVRGGRAKYLGRVLRIGAGDRFVAMDGSGRRWLCSVLELGSDREGDLLRLRVAALSPGTDLAGLRDIRGGRSRTPVAEDPGSEAPPLPPITLIQALPKGAKMDLIVRQAAETGVSRILPLISRRCLPNAQGEAAAKRGRWERIAREALQQSGSGIPTRVEAPVLISALQRALGGTEAAAAEDAPAGGLRLLLHETPLAQVSLHEYLTETPVEIAVCVGPEGGFSDDEVAYLGSLGFHPIHFAGAVLRTETAALFAVAAVEIVLSERSSWMPKPL